ncbi:dihydropteroate synthase [Escherichia coli]
MENGAQIIDINMDEGMLDAEAAMVRFLNLMPSTNRISLACRLLIDLKMGGHRKGAEVYSGQRHSHVNSISMKRRIDAFIHHAKLLRRYQVQRWW